MMSCIFLVDIAGQNSLHSKNDDVVFKVSVIQTQDPWHAIRGHFLFRFLFKISFRFSSSSFVRLFSSSPPPPVLDAIAYLTRRTYDSRKSERMREREREYVLVFCRKIAFFFSCFPPRDDENERKTEKTPFLFFLFFRRVFVAGWLGSYTDK